MFGLKVEYLPGVWGVARLFLETAIVVMSVCVSVCLCVCQQHARPCALTSPEVVKEPPCGTLSELRFCVEPMSTFSPSFSPSLRFHGRFHDRFLMPCDKHGDPVICNFVCVLYLSQCLCVWMDFGFSLVMHCMVLLFWFALYWIFIVKLNKQIYILYPGSVLWVCQLCMNCFWWSG